MLFFFSNATIIINKRPSHIPEVRLPQEPFIEFASTLCSEINNALAVFREIASGRDLKKFLEVIGVLWIISIVGSFCNFITLVYILFVFLHTVPVLYEMYEDKVEVLAEKAMMTIKKKYAAFDAKISVQCGLGDAFRCSTCPYKGLATFKLGKKYWKLRCWEF